jgi:hypothetical protein
MFLFLYKRKQTIETGYANGQEVMGRANHKLGPRFARRPVLSSIFWRVGAGLCHGLDDDGGREFSPPQSQLPSFFVGARIHASISSERHQSLTFAWGERPQDDKQVCVAVHPVTFFAERNSGKPFI